MFITGLYDQKFICMISTNFLLIAGANNGPSATQNGGQFSGNAQAVGTCLESTGLLDTQKYTTLLQIPDGLHV